jgi:hypothetical protein
MLPAWIFHRDDGSVPRTDRPIKARGRGFTGGQLLVGLADVLVGLDRRRADRAGQVLSPVAGLGSTTAAGLAWRFSEGQWHAVETGIGDIHTAMLAALAPQRVAALCETVTIDLDTTDGGVQPEVFAGGEVFGDFVGARRVLF